VRLITRGEEKVNKRRKVKYPALDPRFNLKGRKCYIEADYINGVYNQNGNMVMRPLTDDEKEWLNKYYEETVVTSFNRDGTDLYDSDEDRRKFYKDNNTRNVCLYNMMKKTGRLHSIDITADNVTYELEKSYDPENIMIRMQDEGIQYSDELEYEILKRDRLEEEKEKLKKKSKKSK
jgi:hypothetical protein